MPTSSLPFTVQNKPACRLSVSLTPEQYRQLNEIARKNRVSAAWGVREAVERLLKTNQPLVQVNPA